MQLPLSLLPSVIFEKQMLLTFAFINILYIVIVSINWRAYTVPPRRRFVIDAKCTGNLNKTRAGSARIMQTLFICSFLFYLLFAFDGGDYYHYYESVTSHDYSRVEKIYSYLGALVGHNYLLFRLFVWGGALFFTCETIKRFKLNLSRTLFCLFTIYILVFDYARASLAMSIFYFGLSFLLIPIKNKRFLSCAIGFLFIALATLFHRSMLVAALMLGMLVIPINKKTLIPIVVVVLASSAILFSFILSAVQGELLSEDVSGKVMEYATQNYHDDFSIFEWIRRMMEYATFFVPVVIATYVIVLSKKRKQVAKPFARLYKVTFGLIMVALGILMIDNLTFVLFYRFLYMTFIPITILISYLFQHHFVKISTYKIILCLGIMCKMFGFMKSLLGGNLA